MFQVGETLRLPETADPLTGAAAIAGWPVARIHLIDWMGATTATVIVAETLASLADHHSLNEMCRHPETDSILLRRGPPDHTTATKAVATMYPEMSQNHLGETIAARISIRLCHPIQPSPVDAVEVVRKCLQITITCTPLMWSYRR
jgi:hypothetical protein